MRLIFRRALCDVGLFKSLRDYVDALVHPSARLDASMAVSHRAFIAPRLLGGVIAFAAMPVYLAARGFPSVIETAVLAWLVAPFFIACFLSRTGHYEGAHILSSLAMTGLVIMVALYTGGMMSSFAAVWLVIVPFEAALSSSRRVIVTASIIAIGAAGLLFLLGSLDQASPVIAEQGQNIPIALGIISATFYATVLAFGIEALTSTFSRLIRAEEDRHQLLAHNVTDVMTRHGRNGTVSFVSPAAKSLFGVNIDELTGHGLFDRVHVADRPAYLTALSDAMNLGEARSIEFRVQREKSLPNGQRGVEFIWVEMRCRPSDPVAGKAAGVDGREVIAVMCDITLHKTQEQALTEARAEAERDRVAKSHFLTTMSHELRTPLNAIIGFSEMLQKEEELRIDAVRRRDYAKLIHESGHHLLSVVNDILEMSKIETGGFAIAMEPFSLAAIIANCRDVLAPKARETGIEIIIGAAEGLPDMVSDKRAVKQILLNLLMNALKFTDRGGRVVISVRQEGEKIAITVEDNGIGIQPEDMPHLGQPFFQARGSYDRTCDGSGLGLSIVKGLTALLCGEVTIESRVGEGSRITVCLPVDCERVRAAARIDDTTSRTVNSVRQVASHHDIRVKKRA